MKRVALIMSVSAIAFSSFAGCAAPAENAEAGTEQAVTTDHANQDFYIVTRPDPRECAAPACGGWFVQRVNDGKTTCADGTANAECYVASIALTTVGLSGREEGDVRKAVESGRAVLKAKLVVAPGAALGTLEASEAWVGATGSAPRGTVYRVADNGIRCITTPCPSTSAWALNGASEHHLHDVALDTTEAEADEESLARATAAVATRTGLLVAGSVDVPSLSASEYFFRVTRREEAACGARGLDGCNAGQFCQHEEAARCGAADGAGRCAYAPDVCGRDLAPVCACDGKTYANACLAAGAGASVARMGGCED